MKKIKNTAAKLSAMLAIFCLFLLAGACNPTGDKSETDYVNEIEAAENAVGDPVLENANDDAGEPQEVTPGDVETEDTTSVVDDDKILKEE